MMSLWGFLGFETLGEGLTSGRAKPDPEGLPGPSTVFKNTNLNILKTHGVDEPLRTRVEAQTVRDDKPIYKLRVRISEDAGEVCGKGGAITYTLVCAGL